MLLITRCGEEVLGGEVKFSCSAVEFDLFDYVYAIDAAGSGKIELSMNRKRWNDSNCLKEDIVIPKSSRLSLCRHACKAPRMNIPFRHAERATKTDDGEGFIPHSHNICDCFFDRNGRSMRATIAPLQMVMRIKNSEAAIRFVRAKSFWFFVW